MLAPKEAVAKARDYLQEVIPDFAALQPKVDQIERTPDSWKITFYAQTGEGAATLHDLMARRRIEKVVSVSVQDGALFAVSNPLPLAS
jgi:hypothetical protein